MSRKRKSYTPEFKTKVVLELLEGEKTLNEIASHYGVLPSSLKAWKRQFLENASLAFDKSAIERFWRTLKYEDIYPKSYNTIKEARKGIGEYIQIYNTQRLHSAIDYKRPDEAYYGIENNTDFTPEVWLREAA